MKSILPAILLLAVPVDALACTCAPNPPVAEAVADSSRVFLGTVTGIEHDGMVQRVTFQVSEHFKGGRTDVLRVQTFAQTASCGYPFREGARYVVYADGDDDALATSTCSRTAVAGNPGGDLEALRAGH